MRSFDSSESEQLLKKQFGGGVKDLFRGISLYFTTLKFD